MFGAAHLDVLATVTGFGDTVDRPGRLVQGFGGTGYNLATALAASGLWVRFGLDLGPGLLNRLLVRDLRRRGIETVVRIHADFPEAGFCAHIVDGDMQAAVSATPIENIVMPEDRIRAVAAGASAIVADCNHSARTLVAITRVARNAGMPVFLAGVSESKALKLADVPPGMATAAFLNRREAYYLRRHRFPDSDDYQGLARHLQTTLIITRDTDGAAVVTVTGTHVMPSRSLGAVRHFLGTGDALMAAALHARIAHAYGWPAALQQALAAVAAVAERDTCNGSDAADVGQPLNRWGIYGQVDPVTELPHRAALQELLDMALRERAWHAHPLIVWYGDIEGFKTINDQYGPAIGDSVLAAVGHALQHALPGSALVARYGGDTFAGFVFGHRAAVDSALRGITTVRADGLVVPVSLRIGVLAVGPQDARRTPEALITAAQEASHAPRIKPRVQEQEVG